MAKEAAADSSTGHVFLVRGDVQFLACDARLLPCDAKGRPLPPALFDESTAARSAASPHEGISKARRLMKLPTSSASAVATWLVNLVGAGDNSVEWRLEGVRQFVQAAQRELLDRPARSGRSRPLIAVPTVDFPAPQRHQTGEFLRGLLQVFAEIVRAEPIDLALVATDAGSFSAAQAIRQQLGSARWPALDDRLRRQARQLAERAARGDLALFLGAGVSANAGLPLWSDLLEKLAEKTDMTAAERAALRGFHPLDRAAILERRIGGREGLQRALKELFSVRQYSLVHLLLAGLPVHEVVTTNYDQLFEKAWMAVQRKPSVLPYAIQRAADSWMLKLHGCVSHSDDIVLTREDHISFGERNQALAGIVQTLLITRHMLFVGFSLSDDNFHRIAEAVRRVVRASAGPQAQEEPFGTALVLERHPLIEELWEKDLDWVGMAPPHRGATATDAEKVEAPRRLEVFLDFLLAEAHDSAHLLDDRFRTILSAEETALRQGLGELLHHLPAVARRARAWERIEQVLANLGHHRTPPNAAD